MGHNWISERKRGGEVVQYAHVSGLVFAKRRSLYTAVRRRIIYVYTWYYDTPGPHTVGIVYAERDRRVCNYRIYLVFRVFRTLRSYVETRVAWETSLSLSLSQFDRLIIIARGSEPRDVTVGMFKMSRGRSDYGAHNCKTEEN